MRRVLLLISGAPGSGKTTIANQLQASLGWISFSKDNLKESIFESTGPSSFTVSRQFGIAIEELLWHIGSRCLAAGASVILESTFQQEFSKDTIEGLERAYEGIAIINVHCQTSEFTRLGEVHRRKGNRSAVHDYTREAMPLSRVQLCKYKLSSCHCSIDYDWTRDGVIELVERVRSVAESTLTGY